MRLRAVILVLGLGVSSVVQGAEFEVEAETIGQGYQLRHLGSAGSAMLDRRRLTQYLNLHAFDLLPQEWTGPKKDRNQIYFTSSMRFDTDFGSFLTKAPVGEDRIRELPRSLSSDQFQLLYAMLAGNDLFGVLDFQLGRQIVFDVLDFYSFDGIDVRVKLPWWVAVEVFSGLEVRVETPLASPIYELDGASSGARDPATCLRLAQGGAPPFDCPFQSGMLAPMVGAALESYGIQIFHGRLAYRRTFSQTAAHEKGDALPESGINEEKISYTLNASLGAFRPFGSIRYNLLVGGWDVAEVGLGLKLRGHSVLIDYLFNAPTFDGDSIFNVFASFAYRDLRATYTTPTLGPWRLWMTSFGRFFGDRADEVSIHPTTDGFALGASVGARRQLGERGHVRFDAYFDDGFGGRRAGGDGSVRYAIMPDELEVEGRLTLVDFASDIQRHNNITATSFGVQAGVRYALAEGVVLHFLGEENNNRYYPVQLRAIALLDLTFMR